MRLVPFHRPYRSGTEQARLAACLAAPDWHSDGPAAAMAVRELERALGRDGVLLTPSCTHALELIALALGIGPQDEVIVPSYTFVSTASAFALRGARLRFADIEFDSLGLCPRDVERKLSARTRAVVCVHYGGLPCAIEQLRALLVGTGATLIEDNAHGLFGSVSGRPLGSLGDASAMSFHSTKNISCGEGGALFLAEPALRQRAEVLREKGVDRAAFLRGEVPAYTWREVGSSYLLAEPLAALLYAQLECAPQMQAARLHRFWRYQTALAPLAEAGLLQIAHVPPGVTPAAHLFWLRTRDVTARDGLLAHLRTRGVDARFHYQPLHSSVVGQRWSPVVESCPHSDAAANTLLRLPLYPDLGEDEQEWVIASVEAFFQGSRGG